MRLNRMPLGRFKSSEDIEERRSDEDRTTTELTLAVVNAFEVATVFTVAHVGEATIALAAKVF